MYQAETPVGLCKYRDNEKGKLACTYLGYLTKQKLI